MYIELGYSTYWQGSVHAPGGCFYQDILGEPALRWCSKSPKPWFVDSARLLSVISGKYICSSYRVIQIWNWNKLSNKKSSTVFDFLNELLVINSIFFSQPMFNILKFCLADQIVHFRSESHGNYLRCISLKSCSINMLSLQSHDL